VQSCDAFVGTDNGTGVGMSGGLPSDNFAADSGGGASAFNIIGGVDPSALPLYICLAPYLGSVQPGRVNGIRTGSEGCHFGFGGKEVVVASYNLPTPHYSRQPDAIAHTTFVAGHESDGTPLFACIGFFNGRSIPGKYRPGFGNACVIASGGKEIFAPLISVLSKD